MSPTHKYITQAVWFDRREISHAGPTIWELALSVVFLYFFFLFKKKAFAEKVCGFNGSPSNRKDLHSSPVHTNNRARVPLTACRSAVPFMHTGYKKRLQGKGSKLGCLSEHWPTFSCTWQILAHTKSDFDTFECIFAWGWKQDRTRLCHPNSLFEYVRARLSHAWPKLNM